MSEHRERPSKAISVSEVSAPVDSTRESEGGASTRRPQEIGGPKGLEPTRYGDWEKAGRCIDF